MNKEEVITLLDELANSLAKTFGRAVMWSVNEKFKGRKHKRLDYSREDLAKTTMRDCGLWFDKIKPNLVELQLPKQLIEELNSRFKMLLENVYYIASEYYQVDSMVIELFKAIKFQLIPYMYSVSDQNIRLGSIEEILETVTNSERNYLAEAIGCARYSFFKAAIVLGWSAAIHRIQTVVAKHDLEKFNEASLEMKKTQKGRFRRYNKDFDVKSLNELQATVFDTDLLWVIEYMGFIDSNQHNRLNTCYTLRCDAAHPSEVPISYENLISFFSDLKMIVFENKRLVHE